MRGALPCCMSTGSRQRLLPAEDLLWADCAGLLLEACKQMGSVSMATPIRLLDFARSEPPEEKVRNSDHMSLSGFNVIPPRSSPRLLVGALAQHTSFVQPVNVQLPARPAALMSEGRTSTFSSL